MDQLINLAYLVAAVLFILGLKGLGSPKTAVRGNLTGAIGMLLAVVATLVDKQVLSYGWVIAGMAVGGSVGAFIARTVKMTSMPQMVALLNGFGGGASLLVALAQFIITPARDKSVEWMVALTLSAFIGSVTFAGSMVAWAKLQGYAEKALQIPRQGLLRVVLGLAVLALAALFVMNGGGLLLFLLVAGALMLGLLLVVALHRSG